MFCWCLITDVGSHFGSSYQGRKWGLLVRYCRHSSVLLLRVSLGTSRNSLESYHCFFGGQLLCVFVSCLTDSHVSYLTDRQVKQGLPFILCYWRCPYQVRKSCSMSKNISLQKICTRRVCRPYLMQWKLQTMRSQAPRNTYCASSGPTPRRPSKRDSGATFKNEV